jgi:hypothetical protein
MGRAVPALFENTGPTGQRAMTAMAAALDPLVTSAESAAWGAAVADHVCAWSLDDGGAKVENLGFPYAYTLGGKPGNWVPTSAIRLQQTPLLPAWGQNRTFVLAAVGDCGLPPPPAYSEDPGSAFYAEAVEVCETVRNLTDEQKAIARFWSDDPMLSSTPPGHWLAILIQLAREREMDAAPLADALARLGVAVADAFIACWADKYRYDLVRPVTYINRLIDKGWQPLLTTPPFPEYPSGHSSQSGAAAEVLTAIFGDGFAFDDAAHEDEGLPARHFGSFREAAREAALSRLYGGIHYRSAIERGLEQGACVGARAVGLVTL